ncbi:MAG: hypothetical protein E7L00_10620 [Propionibacteriaceae bacterium]|nr:hypothetical protein [Propionibacteriaceae bacterium]
MVNETVWEALPTTPSPPPRALMSITEAARVLSRPQPQIQLLSEAHALGQLFTFDTPDNTKGINVVRHVTLCKRSHVEWLYQRPRRTKQELLDAKLIPGPAVVVIRHLSPRAPSPEEARYDPRNYYGYDHDCDWSTDLAKVVQQDDASRRWWPISATNRELLHEIECENTSLPMLLTVGGLIVGAREIVGLDHELSELYEPTDDSRRKWAVRVRPAGDWFTDDLLHTWLIAGAGRPILWWKTS